MRLGGGGGGGGGSGGDGAPCCLPLHSSVQFYTRRHVSINTLMLIMDGEAFASFSSFAIAMNDANRHYWSYSIGLVLLLLQKCHYNIATAKEQALSHFTAGRPADQTVCLCQISLNLVPKLFYSVFPCF